ncbi:cell division protein SepF [soil metagenome]
MALRDTWHKTMVYFGLAEDDRYPDEPDLEEVEPHPEPETQLRSRYRERPNVRRLSNRRRGGGDIEEIFSDEPERTESRSTRQLRAVPPNGRAGVQVHLVVPKNFNDAQQIADQFKNELPVILNLQGTDTELAKRLIDFSSGLTYALDGGMQKVAEKVFMLTPPNVEVSAEERARLIEKGFYNQS